MPLIDGQILEGKYEILRLLARGGIGEVYLGVNRRLEKRVAIKVLSGVLAQEPVVARRFEQEARVASKIRSAHVAETFDLGTLPSGESFIVMELLEGETLGERLERRRNIEERTLAAIALQILDALESAHAAGVVHRDLKPENVFLTKRDGRDFVKLLDFGISKVVEQPDPSGITREARALTVTGAVLGTPLYMSPEQARGKNVDARTDLYALGVMLYEAALGEAPFTAKNVNELLFRVALDNPTPLELRLPSVSPELAAIVRIAMAKAPSDRYPSAVAMRDAVLAWQETCGPMTSGARGSMPSLREGLHSPYVSTPTPRPWSLSRAEADETLAELDGIVPRRRSKKPLFAVAALAGLVALGATHPQKVRAMSAQVAQRAHDFRGDSNARASAPAPFISIEFPPPKASAAAAMATVPVASMASIPVASVPAAAPTNVKPTANGAAPSAAVGRHAGAGLSGSIDERAQRPKITASPPKPDARMQAPVAGEENAEPVQVETKL